MFNPQCLLCLVICFYEICINDIISQTQLKLANTFKVTGTWDTEKETG